MAAYEIASIQQQLSVLLLETRMEENLQGVVGGYVSRAMRENKYVVRQNELLDDITVLLAGREAERAIFGEISGGAWMICERLQTLHPLWFKNLQ